MKRTLLTIAALAVIAIPTAAVAKPGHGKGHGQAVKVANKACKAERAEMGNREFRALYGKRALKQCRSVAMDEALSAVDACRAELEALGVEAFTVQYGADGVGKAFGDCVSAKVRDAIDPDCTVDDPIDDEEGGGETVVRQGDDLEGDDEGDDDEGDDDDGCETPQGDDEGHDDGDHGDDDEGEDDEDGDDEEGDEDPPTEEEPPVDGEV